ncbi:hypothetical protein M885DRAFT_568044, partial [Pelagophyceae sp. CCMP2097]
MRFRVAVAWLLCVRVSRSQLPDSSGWTAATFRGASASRTGAAVGLSDDGNVLAYSAPAEANEIEKTEGCVHVYEDFGEGWFPKGASVCKDDFGAAANFESTIFGANVALSGDGAVFAVQAKSTADGASNAYVETFRFHSNFDGSSWKQQGGILASPSFGDGNFGAAISLSPDGVYLAVGAPELSAGNFEGAGAAFFFQFQDGAWSEGGVVVPADGAFDNFGASIALSQTGLEAAVGAPGRVCKSGRGRCGSVRFYAYNGSAAVLAGSEQFGDTAGDEFGASVALSADGLVMAVGAPQIETVGMVRIFEWNGQDWSQKGQDIFGQAANEEFGFKVVLNAAGNLFAATAVANANGSGGVRVFEFDGSWFQRGEDIQGTTFNGGLGYALAMDATGDAFAAGAPGADVGADGEVKVFSFGFNEQVVTTAGPTRGPTLEATFEPTIKPTFEATFEATFKPTIKPTFEPTPKPTPVPTPQPTP